MTTMRCCVCDTPNQPLRATPMGQAHICPSCLKSSVEHYERTREMAREQMAEAEAIARSDADLRTWGAR